MVLIIQEAGWTQGRSGGAENLASTGIRFPDRPACSYSLYRLSYHGPPLNVVRTLKCRRQRWDGNVLLWDEDIEHTAG
jgi:hypothetical protein